MRKLKFRAWTGQQMLYQDQQYLASFIRRVVPKIILHHGGSEFRDHESYLPNGGVIDEYLMQWTGLLDKNGKGIYEGDIVRRSGDLRPFTVVWDRDGYWLQVAKDEGGVIGIDPHCEVVGNIYETPELRGEQP